MVNLVTNPLFLLDMLVKINMEKELLSKPRLMDVSPTLIKEIIA